MKSLITIAIAALILTACGTVPPKAASIHQEYIGTVQVTYDDDGNWIKVATTGFAPLHNNTPAAITTATKVAKAMAYSHLSEFMNNSVDSTNTVDVSSNSNLKSGASDTKSAGDIETLTAVVEHIRTNSSSIMRGVYVSSQNIMGDRVQVELTATKQSIGTSGAISATMSGN
jgi:hypothetical protein